MLEYYMKARPQSLVRDNIRTFNDVLLLFLLESQLLSAGPDNGLKIIKHLIEAWNKQIARNSERESETFKARVAGLSSEELFRIFDSDDIIGIELAMEKMLQKGKADSFSVIDHTLNQMMINLETKWTEKQKREVENE